MSYTNLPIDTGAPNNELEMFRETNEINKILEEIQEKQNKRVVIFPPETDYISSKDVSPNNTSDRVFRKNPDNLLVHRDRGSYLPIVFGRKLERPNLFDPTDKKDVNMVITLPELKQNNVRKVAEPIKKAEPGPQRLIGSVLVTPNILQNAKSNLRVPIPRPNNNVPQYNNVSLVRDLNLMKQKLRKVRDPTDTLIQNLE